MALLYLWCGHNSVELCVMGVADEVESVTRRLAAGLASSSSLTGKDIAHSSRRQARWIKSRKAWVFTVGLATIVALLPQCWR